MSTGESAGLFGKSSSSATADSSNSTVTSTTNLGALSSYKIDSLSKDNWTGCLLSEMEFCDVLISLLPKSWDRFMSTFLGAQSGAEDSGQSHMNLQEMMALIKDEYKHCIGGAGNKCKLDEGNEQIYYLESSGKRH